MKCALMEHYKLTKEQAGLMTEYDYCFMVVRNNLKALKENYKYKKDS